MWPAPHSAPELFRQVAWAEDCELLLEHSHCRLVWCVKGAATADYIPGLHGLVSLCPQLLQSCAVGAALSGEIWFIQPQQPPKIFKFPPLKFNALEISVRDVRAVHFDAPSWEEAGVRVLFYWILHKEVTGQLDFEFCAGELVPKTVVIKSRVFPVPDCVPAFLRSFVGVVGIQVKQRAGVKKGKKIPLARLFPEDICDPVDGPIDSDAALLRACGYVTARSTYVTECRTVHARRAGGQAHGGVTKVHAFSSTRRTALVFFRPGDDAPWATHVLDSPVQVYSIGKTHVLCRAREDTGSVTTPYYYAVPIPWIGDLRRQWLVVVMCMKIHS